MELKDLRNEIDLIDDELVKLFTKRMDISAQIAGYKKENSLPIFVPAREREKLADVAKKALRDADAGKDISVYSLYVKAAHVTAKLLPQRIMMKLWLWQQKM